MRNDTNARIGVSFILPIFNVESYLKKCLDSIERQTSNHWEAILVDDGSTDNSSAICKMYVAKNPKFKYIYQINQGQGVARNQGLKLAAGRYVCFVDPDDWIKEESVYTLLEVMDESDADFANFGIEFVTNNGKLKRKFQQFSKKELTGRVIFHKALIDSEIFTSPCNKIYRLSFLREHNIEFPPFRAYEDVFFSRYLSLHARKCLFIDKVLYYALIRSESTTRKLTPLKIKIASDIIHLEKATFIVPTTSFNELEIFNAHVLKFTTYMLFQAAFRVASFSDYLLCAAAMHSSFKPAIRETPLAIRYLPVKNQILVCIAFVPKAAYLLAKLLGFLRYKPY